jgi:hypothetical protein
VVPAPPTRDPRTPHDTPPPVVVPPAPTAQMEGAWAASETSVTELGVQNVGGDVVAASRFAATTDGGEFAIDQSVRLGGAPALVLAPTVTTDGTTQTLTLGQVAIERTIADDGSLSLTAFVSVDAAVDPTPATPEAPQASAPLPSSLTVSLVLSADRKHIVSERVAVAL